jgi:hypothetical protein
MWEDVPQAETLYTVSINSEFLRCDNYLGQLDLPFLVLKCTWHCSSDTGIHTSEGQRIG